MCGASIKYKARCEQTAALWMKFSPQLLEKFQLVWGKMWKYTNKLWEVSAAETKASHLHGNVMENEDLPQKYGDNA